MQFSSERMQVKSLFSHQIQIAPLYLHSSIGSFPVLDNLGIYKEIYDYLVIVQYEVTIYCSFVS